MQHLRLLSMNFCYTDRVTPPFHVRCLSVPLLGAVIIAVVLFGCSKSSYDINGQVFIVTKGAGDYKLGLVTVTAFRRSDIDALVTTMKARFDEARKEIGPSAEAASNTYIADIKSAEQLRIKVDQEQNRGVDAADDMELLDIAQAKEDAAKKESDRLYALIFSTASVESFFSQLPSVWITVVKTDADGRFTMRLPANEDVVLVAQATRAVLDETESYYWVVPVERSPTTSSSEFLLSNDNLTTSKSSPWQNLFR